jgi:hypothetical protein
MHTTCAMYSSILYISQMIININCPSKVVSRHHVHPCVPHVSPDEDPHSDITELNDEEDNDDDDKSDTEDDTVVDSVDASYVNLTLNVRHFMILYKEGTYLKPVSSCSSSKTSQYSIKMSFGKASTLSVTTDHFGRAIYVNNHLTYIQNRAVHCTCCMHFYYFLSGYNFCSIF